MSAPRVAGGRGAVVGKSAGAGTSEFELIRRFTAAFDVPAPPFGPGDDAALIPASSKKTVVTADAVVEGVHFSRRTFSLEDVGHKALAVNLSDLAAMGAKPAWFLCSIAAKKGLSVSDVEALGAGMARLAKAARIRLVGGNFTRADALSVNVTAVGEVDRPVLRSGGRPGHILYVSGTLGDAAFGLSLLERDARSDGPFVAAQKRPLPKLRLGRIAAKFASAGMDLSDGLGQDLFHLAAASKVGAHVEVERLPVDPALAAAHPSEWPRFALSGGEDYGLLLAVPPKVANGFERACAQAKERITRVGKLTQRGGPVAFTFGGKPWRALGFDHFRR